MALFNQTDVISCLVNAGGAPDDEGKSSRGSDQFSLETDLPKFIFNGSAR